MSDPDSVLAVCVNWNGRDVLPQTLDSLLHSSYAGLRILVVDNASEDGSVASLPDEVELVSLESNLGYGGAINAVLERSLEPAPPDYFLLLNNDVVLARDTVSALIEYARQKGPGIFGPQIVQFAAPDRLEAAWGKVTWSHVLVRYRGENARKTDSPWKSARQVDLLLGSALLVHRQVFETAGVFDDHFFMYHEEVDFLFRARREGFPVYYCPVTEVVHHGAHSTRRQPLKKTYWIRKNAIYFLRKHRAAYFRWVYFWTTLGASLLFNTIMFRWARTRIIVKAVKEGLAS